MEFVVVAAEVLLEAVLGALELVVVVEELDGAMV